MGTPAVKDGLVYICTPDKDMAQLVRDVVEERPALLGETGRALGRAAQVALEFTGARGAEAERQVSHRPPPSGRSGPPRAAAPSVEAVAPRAEPAPAAPAEFSITVPVLLTRAQIRSGLPVRVLLDIRVKDE
jgi:uncharacterized membrane protein